MDLRIVGLDGVDWILVARDGGQWRAVVNAATNVRFPQTVENLTS
jgi:hypothetical protein